MIDLERYIKKITSEYDKNIPYFTSKDISVIIPTVNRFDSLNRLINSILKTHSEIYSPKEIIIIDNNVDNSYTVKNIFCNSPIPIKILKCTKKGAASARNLGAGIAKGKWLLFCDDDCIVTNTFIEGYINSQNGSIAYAGKILAFRNDKFSKYYEQQGILLPPRAKFKNTLNVPMYFVTANALILKKAFVEIKGFNESLIHAAEDVDLSLRLWQVGRLSFAFESIVFHQFENNWEDFRRRFYIYGKGNKQLEEFYHISKRPKPIVVSKKSVFNYFASKVHYRYLLKGYNSN